MILGEVDANVSLLIALQGASAFCVKPLPTILLLLDRPPPI